MLSIDLVFWWGAPRRITNLMEIGSHIFFLRGGSLRITKGLGRGS